MATSFRVKDHKPINSRRHVQLANASKSATVATGSAGSVSRLEDAPPGPNRPRPH